MYFRCCFPFCKREVLLVHIYLSAAIGCPAIFGGGTNPNPEPTPEPTSGPNPGPNPDTTPDPNPGPTDPQDDCGALSGVCMLPSVSVFIMIHDAVVSLNYR